jgi:hypothetical protein
MIRTVLELARLKGRDRCDVTGTGAACLPRPARHQLSIVRASPDLPLRFAPALRNLSTVVTLL